MKILIIGGTQFVGRHLVDALLTKNHDVTLFHRGQTNKNLFPRVGQIFGDRDGEIDKLKGLQWDLCIDTCGYAPRVVRQSCELLKSAVGNYLFISTGSVYHEDNPANMTEDARRKDPIDESIEEVDRHTYGPLKVMCEDVVTAIFPDNHLIIRPGIIIGPHDPTDRLAYWLRRFSSADKVLCPDTKDQPVQLIDMRDLAVWMEKIISEKQTGVFNAVGPDEPIPFGEFVTRLRAMFDGMAEPVWVPKRFILDADLEPGALPYWLSGKEDRYNLFRVSADKARKIGLTYRSLEESFRDTYDWDINRGDVDLTAGLSKQREKELLKQYSQS